MHIVACPKFHLRVSLCKDLFICGVSVGGCASVCIKLIRHPNTPSLLLPMNVNEPQNAVNHAPSTAVLSPNNMSNTCLSKKGKKRNGY